MWCRDVRWFKNHACIRSTLNWTSNHLKSRHGIFILLFFCKDASNVYGSDAERSKKLRIENDPAGRLKSVFTEEFEKEMLPFSEDDSEDTVEMGKG